jgi:hypothetical protein
MSYAIPRGADHHLITYTPTHLLIEILYDCMIVCLYTHTYPYLPIPTHTYPYLPIPTHTYPLYPIVSVSDYVVSDYVVSDMGLWV